MKIATAPLAGLLDVWGQLTEAMHGVHGFGGDTAEVYVYLLLPWAPLRVHASGATKAREDAMAAEDARWALHDLLKLFTADRGLVVTIDGWPWTPERPPMPTIHRWHIKVENNDNGRDRAGEE